MADTGLRTWMVVRAAFSMGEGSGTGLLASIIINGLAILVNVYIIFLIIAFLRHLMELSRQDLNLLQNTEEAMSTSVPIFVYVPPSTYTEPPAVPYYAYSHRPHYLHQQPEGGAPPASSSSMHGAPPPPSTPATGGEGGGYHYYGTYAGPQSQQVPTNINPSESALQKTNQSNVARNEMHSNV